MEGGEVSFVSERTQSKQLNEDLKRNELCLGDPDSMVTAYARWDQKCWLVDTC